MPCPQEQEGAPEPPRSGDVGGPITISDGSGGDRPSKGARSVDEEVEASRVAKRTPWPIGLHSVEERRRRKRKSTSGSRSNSCRRSRNDCRRSSNGRDGREKKKKRKDGGNKENGSRSCWNSRGSNNKRVSS